MQSQPPSTPPLPHTLEMKVVIAVGESTRSYDIFPAFSMNSPVVPPPSCPSWGEPNVNSRPRLSIIAVNSAPHATWKERSIHDTTHPHERLARMLGLATAASSRNWGENGYSSWWMGRGELNDGYQRAGGFYRQRSNRKRSAAATAAAAVNLVSSTPLGKGRKATATDGKLAPWEGDCSVAFASYNVDCVVSTYGVHTKPTVAATTPSGTLFTTKMCQPYIL